MADDPVIKGLTEEQTETIILIMQKQVYPLKEEWEARKKAVESVKIALAKAESDAKYAEDMLRGVLEFLSIYNAEAHEDWFAEIGVER